MGVIPDIDAALLVIDVDVAMQAAAARAGSAIPRRRSCAQLAEARRPVVLARQQGRHAEGEDAAAAACSSAWARTSSLRAIVPVSATKGTNVDRLVGELWALLPAGPPLYGAGHADRSQRALPGQPS